MKKNILFIMVGLLIGVTMYGQKERRYGAADIWYRSEAIGANRLSWRDSSGQKRDGHTTTGYKSNDKGINYQRSVLFEDAQTLFTTTYNQINSSRLTVIVVYHSPDTLKEQGIWSMNVNGHQLTGLTDRRLLRQKSEYVYPVRQRGIPLINTSKQSFGKIREKTDSSYFVLGESRLLDSTLLSFKGSIAECLVFKRFLKSEETIKIESYLGIKYGITLIASDYVSSSGKKIWNYEENAVYSNGIAGIGRDGVFGLHQKQGSSTEEPDLLTICVDSIAAWNTQNKSSIAEGTYLLWGHNTGALACNSDVSCEEAYPLWERKWLVEATYPDSQSALSTLVRLRLPEEERMKGQAIYLVIDRSGLGDFSDATYISQTDTGGEYVYFRDVVWDTDGSGKDVFGFSYGLQAEVVSKGACPDTSNGSLSLSVCGGKAPYQYELTDSNGAVLNYSGARIYSIEGLRSGEYLLKISDSNGQQWTDTVLIETYPIFQLEMPQNLLYSSSYPIVLDALDFCNGVMMTSYRWEKDSSYYNDSNVIAINGIGKYILTTIDSNGCQSYGETEVVSVANTFGKQKSGAFKGENENSLIDSELGISLYNVYPNPSTGFFRIEAKLPESSPIKIAIYLVNGTLIREIQDNGKSHYSIEEYLPTAGNYLIRIATEFEQRDIKLIISH